MLGSQTRVQFRGSSNPFLLQKPQPTDGGVYKCNIKNEFGELNANLNLNIEGSITRSTVGGKFTYKEINKGT